MSSPQSTLLNPFPRLEQVTIIIIICGFIIAYITCDSSFDTHNDCGGTEGGREA